MGTIEKPGAGREGSGERNRISFLPDPARPVRLAPAFLMVLTDREPGTG